MDVNVISLSGGKVTASITLNERCKRTDIPRVLSALNAAKIDSIFTDKASGKNLQREGFEALLSRTVE